MRDLVQEIRYAVRGLAQRPGFTLAAVVTLALGIGANTAIFGVVHHVLLRRPPYPDPDRLVALHFRSSGGPGEGETDLPWSYPYFDDLRRDGSAFRQVAAYAGWHFNLTGAEQPERLPVEIVSAEYFPVLGVRAAVGRAFLPEEDRTRGTHPVALIGYDLWQRVYGGDPGVLGKSIHLDGRTLTIVGVAPRGFRGLTGQAQTWIPMMMAPELLMPRRLDMRFAHWHQVVARLAPGGTSERAGTAMDAFLARQNRETPPPEGYGRLSIAVVPLREDRLDPALARGLLLLSLAVGFVLLIACVNVVNLLLVRALALRRDTAVRVALGASRLRLVRRFVAESLVLGVAGGLVGLLVAVLGIRLATVYGPVDPFSGPFEIAPPPAVELGAVRLGGVVLGLNLLFSVLAGLLLGLPPALQAARLDVNAWIREGARGLRSVREMAGRLRRLDTRGLLVVAEVALSLVLLIGAGLLTRSFLQLYAARLGFEPKNVLTLRISHPFRGGMGPDRTTFDLQLLERVGALPGVEAASYTNRLPVSVQGETALVTIQGKTFREGEEPAAGVFMITPKHFQALRIPLRRGRPFTAEDREGAARVAILNETAARRLFPGEDPLGQRIQLSLGWEDFAEVVGVVGDVRYGRLDEEVGADIYVPYLQNPDYPFAFLTVRAAGAPETLVPAMRQAVRDLNPDVPLFDIQTMDERIAQAASRFRFTTLLLGLFAGVACILAAIGLYGVMAYSVSGRTSEIGVRMALGARPGQVAGAVIRDGLFLAGSGVVLGLGLAILTTRLLASFLYQLGSTDPATYAAAAILLLAVSLLASYLPARRAVKVDPGTALRYG